MSRKLLVALLLLFVLAVASVIWLFWAELLAFSNGFLALDKDQLELWGTRRDLIWPVLPMIAAVGLFGWGMFKLVWSKAAKDENSASAQRTAELAYLKNLLREYDLQDVAESYTRQEGDIQQHEHLPERFFKAALRYDRHKAGDEPHQANTPPEHHDDLLAAFGKHKWLVLLGEPGMGKTFSLWRIAAEYASHARKNPRQPLPVIIPLNEWLDEQQTLNEFVLKQMQELAPFHDALRDNKRLLPLLDALNEIPVGQREKKLEQVKEWIKRKDDYPGLLLTCRLRDYTLELVQDLDRLTIEPLTPPRIQEFLRNYFRHFFKHGAGADKTADALFWQLTGGEGMQQAWKNWQSHKPGLKMRLRHWFDGNYTKPTWTNFWKPEQLEGWYWQHYYSDGGRLQHLNNPRSLLKLAENPYLLSMMAKIFHESGQLPESRRSLFEHFVGVLLDREQRDKNRKPEDIPPRPPFENKLKQLAWELQGRGNGQDDAQTTLLRSDAEQIVPAEWIRFAHAASLLEIVGDKVRFSHQLLQEFYTAQSFKERREQGWQASQIWPADKWWQPNGWEEAARMAVEYEEDPTVFLQWLAGNDYKRVAGNPKLAAEIARDHQLNDALEGFRKQWQSAITDIKTHLNPHERHAISTALAWLGWDDRRPGIGLDAKGLPDIDWVGIPGGKFIYQDGETEETLPTFKMSRYLVTNAQFQAFVTAEDGYNDDRWWQDLKKPGTPHKSYWQESNRPVESVDWYESMAFCRWLSSKKGLDIRLPTEQEWEKAARYPDGLEYPWVGGYKTGCANINETWEHDKVGEYNLHETSAVGIYPNGKSHLGLMDMAGNVWEWCLNKYDKPEMVAPDLSNDWRVVRGGSWDYFSVFCRSSVRFGWLPHYRLRYQGFRVVLCLRPPFFS